MEDAPPKSSNGRAALLRRLAEQQLGPTGRTRVLPNFFGGLTTKSAQSAESLPGNAGVCDPQRLDVYEDNLRLTEPRSVCDLRSI